VEVLSPLLAGMFKALVLLYVSQVVQLAPSLEPWNCRSFGSRATRLASGGLLTHSAGRAPPARGHTAAIQVKGAYGVNSCCVHCRLRCRRSPRSPS